MPPWCAADEVYGRSAQLRGHLKHHHIGYVLRVGSAFHLTVTPGTTLRTDALLSKELTNKKR